MKHVSRRAALKGAVASTTTALLGCGGGDPSASEAAEGTDMQALGERSVRLPDVAVTPPLERAATEPALDRVIVPAVTSKYRAGQPYLFQTIRQRYVPSRLPLGSPLDRELFGPTYDYVDRYVGWAWNHRGGDWIDANGVQQGTVPWFSVLTSAASGSSAVAAYRVDATKLVKFVQVNNRFCAIRLVSPNAPRSLAGTASTKYAKPFIDVRYVGGTQVRLACRVTAVTSSGSTMSNTMQESCALPLLLEFERPTAPVESATLNFVVTQHWSGSNPVINGFLLDPPMNVDPVRPGVAATAGRLDEGLDQNPSIIGVHRYLDGTNRSAYIAADKINVGAEREFDPAIWGRGPRDTTLLPHRHLGKWLNAGDNWDFVNSSYTGEGFQALAPGLGALRVHMDGSASLTNGSVVGYGGTLAANGFIFLPEELFGRLGRIFVRHYFRLGSTGGMPYQPNVADRLHVYNDASRTTPAWTDCAGKFGIMPEHVTSSGGVSGSAGGGAGWQMRMSWSDCDNGMGGPDEAGWSAGYHLYDFYWRNPKGYNYSGDSGNKAKLGQRGGLGGILYANEWYCMESEIKLNTAMPQSPGYLPDGELRTWIDGRLAFERTGMVFRTLPILNETYSPTRMRPCRELGVRGLWFNWFHGGKTLNVKDRTIFVTGLAWGKDYIGPMTL
jgi:hypothetical protein